VETMSITAYAASRDADRQAIRACHKGRPHRA
jgi:hypothetical protein